mgnify:CR=1 FL=1
MEKPSDTEMLDWLDRQNQGTDWRGLPLGTVFRMSTTGRGWRLHQCTGEFGVARQPNVRAAIMAAMGR